MIVRQYVSHESSDLMGKKINIKKSYVNDMKKILIITLLLLLIYHCLNKGEIIKENHYEISMRRLNYRDDEKISNIEDINFDNGNIIIKLKSGSALHPSFL